jgi:hypothetical protein
MRHLQARAIMSTMHRTSKPRYVSNLSPLGVLFFFDAWCSLNDGQALSAGCKMLKQVTQTEPYYKHNQPHVCYFYTKGESNCSMECLVWITLLS